MGAPLVTVDRRGAPLTIRAKIDRDTSAYPRLPVSDDEGATATATKTVTVTAEDATGTVSSRISFEDASVGASLPNGSWSFDFSQGDARISDERATHGSQSYYLAGSPDLEQVRATHPVNLTDVSELRVDIYVESTHEYAGDDITVLIDGISNQVIERRTNKRDSGTGICPRTFRSMLARTT